MGNYSSAWQTTDVPGKPGHRIRWNHNSKKVTLFYPGDSKGQEFADALLVAGELRLATQGMNRRGARDALGIPKAPWDNAPIAGPKAGAPKPKPLWNAAADLAINELPTDVVFTQNQELAQAKSMVLQAMKSDLAAKAAKLDADLASKGADAGVAEEAMETLQAAVELLNKKAALAGPPKPPPPMPGIGPKAHEEVMATAKAKPLERIELRHPRRDPMVQAAENLVEWVWGIRERIEAAQKAGHRTRRVAGTRMIQAGVRLLAADVSLKQTMARLLVGWSADEIDKLVPSGVSGTTKPPKADFKGVVHEGVFLIKAGFNNIFFVGPPGCGKTTLAKNLADDLGLKFEAIPCNEELPSSAFYGRMVADGSFVGTAFTDIFENGGIFLFDEIFKMAPTVSVALNMALANGYFYNTAAKRRMVRHDQCYIIGASNSFGLGSAQFGTDAPQDPAFLDRFMGAAVQVTYDTTFELQVARDVRLINKAKHALSAPASCTSCTNGTCSVHAKGA